MSGVMCQLSSVRCQVSGVRCRVSDVRCQVSGVRCLVSGVRCQVSGVRCQVSPVTSMCHMSPIFIHLIFDNVVKLFGGRSVIKGAYPQINWASTLFGGQYPSPMGPTV